MTEQIRIPVWLREFHGESASLSSLVTTYVAGASLGLYCYVLSENSLVGWQGYLLLILAVDIGGGAVANMSDSTSAFYSTRPKLRWVFIALHSIHPLLIWLIFPTEMSILAVGATVLAFTSMVNIIREKEAQRIIAALFMVIILIAIYLASLDNIISILLIVYAIKLVLGFAVRWTTER